MVDILSSNQRSRYYEKPTKESFNSILKVILLSFYLVIILNPYILSAQNTRLQEVEQAEQGQEELNQELVTAVTNGCVDEARELLGQGADVNVVYEYGRIPLHVAAAEGDELFITTAIKI